MTNCLTRFRRFFKGFFQKRRTYLSLCRLCTILLRTLRGIASFTGSTQFNIPEIIRRKFSRTQRGNDRNSHHLVNRVVRRSTTPPSTSSARALVSYLKASKVLKMLLCCERNRCECNGIDNPAVQNGSDSRINPSKMGMPPT